ncbi:MAG: NACHT domain-containing protein, partial [Pseudomonadota bacterium]|nr:NACHT domain-containing protein [Pseudomonadota bacterium]
PVELRPVITACFARPYGGNGAALDLLKEDSWMAAPRFVYCAKQRLRMCTPVHCSSVYPETFATLGFVSGWRDATTDETAAAHAGTFMCEGHHAPALLTQEAMESEHTRFVRHLVETLGKHVDAFSGVTMDLETQTVTLQYKQGSERDALLGSADRKDFDAVGDNILDRQRKGSMVAEIRRNAVDGSCLLDDVIAAGGGWTKGCYTGQTCALVLGPAASGKTTLLRRFAVEIARERTRFVPIFATVIDIVRLAASQCRSEHDRPRELFEAVVAKAAASTGALAARFLAQAVCEHRAVFLIDGMDEAGEQVDLVEAMLAEQIIHRGHRLIVTSRHSGLTDGLRQALSGEQHRVVQLLPLDGAQQRAMALARLPDAEQVEAFTAATHDRRLAELAQNPLMLTMLLSIFARRGGSLPEKRSELYESALRAMLERVDTACKGGHGALDLEP